ncbi:MAG: tRNA (adenosine(37)-N6)-threonylcarbamoyltransferase complex ATPase subunit type 1 TsaE [Flavobacteriaceae bacterium]|jgi:tRNA threonylcarbamoyladenosine biosynthesis protein TsaE|nr:tRNA (adenosine(37)-N6)-threonylcarbamoyltransferase complex ATPase subunit type 1 TsaE [Flavobacteriaceae bacterium]
MKIEFSLNEINFVAQQVLEQNSKKVILFNGEMGAGKTTFIKALAKEIGVSDVISSPTFSLINEYETTNGEPVYHFDFYRLKNESEALDFGVEDYLYSGNYCFLEWPEKIRNLIPEEHTNIEIRLLENGNRELEMK